MTTAVSDRTLPDLLAAGMAAVEEALSVVRAPVRLTDGSDPRLAALPRLNEAILDLSSAVSGGSLEHDCLVLFQLVAALDRDIRRDHDGTDPDEEIRLGLLRMEEVLLRMGERRERDRLEDVAAAWRFIDDRLAGVAPADLAAILGVTTKSLSNWRSGRPIERATRRVRLVAQLVAALGASLSASEIVYWFNAPRPAFGNRTPRELLDEDPQTAGQVLTSYARGTLDQLAT